MILRHERILNTIWYAPNSQVEDNESEYKYNNIV